MSISYNFNRPPMSLVRRKLKSVVYLLKLLLAFLPASAVVLMARLIRPMVLIRFGILRSERIGHYALDTEFYLAEKELGLHPGSLDFFSHAPLLVHYHICNLQLRDMYDRVLKTNDFVAYLYKINNMIPGGEAHSAKMVTRTTGRDLLDVLYKTKKPHISFTGTELEKGRTLLERMGIPGGREIICVHTRDKKYLDTVYPGIDWSCHDYRNSNIDDYVSAMEWLADKKYYILRMGVVVEKPVASKNRYIIDYAAGGIRTDFLDIYIISRCRFMLSTGTGIDAVANVFRKPTVYVNFIPLEQTLTFMPDDLTIYKKLWWSGEKRFVRFGEIVKYGLGDLKTTGAYRENGLEVVDNTPDEIRDAVMEMEQRVAGVWQESDEDKELQERFWNIFPRNPELHNVCRSRIGAMFLRENRELLD